MNPEQYAQHMRRVMMNEAMQRIASISDNLIVTEAFDRVKHIDPKFKRQEFDRILQEGVDPVEVNEMLGLSMNDPIDEINNAPELSSDDFEQLVMESFSETIQLFIDKPGAACIVSFSYADDEEEDEDEDTMLHGYHIAFGDIDTVDALMDNLLDDISESTSDGYVDTLNAPQDSDDKLLDDISSGSTDLT